MEQGQAGQTGKRIFFLIKLQKNTAVATVGSDDGLLRLPAPSFFLKMFKMKQRLVTLN